jgi:2-polyprenyl-3-methyl-5-hydroxy-6-metoxy-1,4-benzoquinol methylase
MGRNGKRYLIYTNHRKVLACLHMFKKIKDALYKVKTWHRMIFKYPLEYITDNPDVDYDAYWDNRHDEYYKARREDDSGGLNSYQKMRADFVAETLKQEHSFSIADIGCGDGGIITYLKRVKQLPVERALGLDSSAPALEIARRDGVTTVLADITTEKGMASIPSADYILLFEILEHVPHTEKLLRKAYKEAHRGVFFSFPNTGFFVYRLRLLLGRMPMQWRKHPGEHVRFWTMLDLRWWLKAQRYGDAHIHSYEGVPYLNRVWPSLFGAAFIVYIGKP